MENSRKHELPAGLNENEKIFYEAALNTPKGLTDEDFKTINLSIESIIFCINSLSRKGLLDIAADGKTNYYRAVKAEDAGKFSQLEGEEKLVYQHIKASGNEGIWTRTLKTKTGLHQQVVMRCLKTLEQKQLVKSVKSVKNPTRKVYMLYELTPSTEVTGGTWYTDQELDVDFIENLQKACFKYIQSRSYPPRAENAVYPANYVHFPTATQVRRFITESRISSVELSLEDITALLDTLIYDGKIEKVTPVYDPADWGDDDDEGQVEWMYRSVKMKFEGDAWTETPCGKCPVSEHEYPLFRTHLTNNAFQLLTPTSTIFILFNAKKIKMRKNQLALRTTNVPKMILKQRVRMGRMESDQDSRHILEERNEGLRKADTVWQKTLALKHGYGDDHASRRQRWAFWVDTSKGGRIWELLDALLNLLFVITYIYNTRYVRTDGKPQPLPLPNKIVEVTLATMLLLQYLPRIYIAPDPLYTLFSYFSLITLLSTVPVMVAFVLSTFFRDMWLLDELLEHTYMSAGYIVYIYPFRFMRLHSSFRNCLAPVQNGLFYLSLIMRKGLQLGLAILFTLLTVTSLVHIVTYKQSKTDKVISFYDAFFFTTVSSTTGMSTNIMPDNSFNRMVILYVMICGAIFIPTNLSELLNLISRKSKYEHSFKPQKGKSHILIGGPIDIQSLIYWLREFFSTDHGLSTVNTQVVILNSNEPSEELGLLLQDPAYCTRVHYVKGSATSFQEEDARDEDAEQVMRALAMKKFNRHLKLYAQVHLPENVPHFDFLAKDVVCLNELNMGLLSQSVLIPGFSSLVLLLTTSITDETRQDLQDGIKCRPDLAWAEEYVNGASMEIYPISFSERFTGLTFAASAEIIYMHFGATLFAIGLYHKSNPKLATTGSGFSVYINPSNYVIEGEEVGFVISDCAETAARIVSLDSQRDDPLETDSLLESVRVESEMQESGPSSLTAGMNISYGSTKTSVPLSSDSTAELEDSSEVPQNTPTQKSGLIFRPNLSDEEEIDVGSDSGSKLSLTRPATPASEKLLDPQLTGKAVQAQNLRDAKNAAKLLDLPCVDGVKNHLLICDPSPSFHSSIDILIGCVRAKRARDPDMPVVILCPASPPDELSIRLQKFGGVFLVKGSPMVRKDLYRAGVQHAKKCIVLANSKQYGSASLRTADSSALLTALNVEALRSEEDDDFFMVVECIHRDSFKLVGESDTIQTSDVNAQAMVRPSFMSGNVYSKTMLDTLICQCYYNRHMLSIVEQLVFSHVPETLSGSFNNDKVDALQHGHLFMIKISPRYVGATYATLFTALLREYNTVPLGLYRRAVHKQHLSSYVYCNPTRRTILQETDQVYVIGEKTFDFI
ncbi:uncharacterized protein VTP21DRAFT_11406 [Calcarisporiella thermophila]|uniref:uncharacterized protein n=1 Tax=Calcarisporiella thermophila TaxID=911321 RepID=UPI00374436CF